MFAYSSFNGSQIYVSLYTNWKGGHWLKFIAYDHKIRKINVKYINIFVSHCGLVAWALGREDEEEEGVEPVGPCGQVPAVSQHEGPIDGHSRP